MPDGKGSERVVGGGKDRERAVAIQGVNQVGCLDRRHECRELLVAGSNIDDGVVTVLACLGWSKRGSKEEQGDQEQAAVQWRSHGCSP